MDDLSFYILPSSNPPKECVTLHNNIYKLWKEVWHSVFQKLGFPIEGLNTDFLRQDAIIAICKADEVASVHLYSFFNLESNAAKESNYFLSNYSKEYFQILKDKGIETVMSMEYMTVSPNWRKHQSDVHVGACMASLGLRLMKSLGIDAAIAPARRDHKVNELAYTFGGECIKENIMNHNVACDLIAIQSKNLKPFPSIPLVRLENELWENRKDFVFHKNENQVVNRSVKEEFEYENAAAN